MLSKLTKVKSYILIIATVFLFLSLSKSVEKVKRANSQVSDARVRVDEVSKENSDLKSRLDSVSQPLYIEKQLRDGLGMAKEGEVVLVLPDDEILRKLAPNDTYEEESLPDPNWKKWKNLFL